MHSFSLIYYQHVTKIHQKSKIHKRRPRGPFWKSNCSMTRMASQDPHRLVKALLLGPWFGSRIIDDVLAKHKSGFIIKRRSCLISSVLGWCQLSWKSMSAISKCAHSGIFIFCHFLQDSQPFLRVRHPSCVADLHSKCSAPECVEAKLKHPFWLLFDLPDSPYDVLTNTINIVNLYLRWIWMNDTDSWCTKFFEGKVVPMETTRAACRNLACWGSKLAAGLIDSFGQGLWLNVSIESCCILLKDSSFKLLSIAFRKNANIMATLHYLALTCILL